MGSVRMDDQYRHSIVGTREELPVILQEFNRIGFVAIDNDLTKRLAVALFNETSLQVGSIKRAARDDKELKYSAGIAELGLNAKRWLESSELLGTLSFLTGHRHSLTKDMSCITVYQCGDQLGPHKDQPPEKCDVTCILYLDCESPNPESPLSGLRLNVFGRSRASISYAPLATIFTKTGRLVIGRGSKVWHERPLLKTGESVVAVTACFGVA